MKKQYPLILGGAALFLLWIGSASCVNAQDSQVASTPENSSAPAAEAAKIKNVPASKPHKVWTDDNVSSVRSDADKYQDRKRAEADAAAANAAAPKAQVKVKEPEPKIGGGAALSALKSSDDAQRMIEWEDRDIDAQQEFLDKLDEQLREASTFEERERLERLINERVAIVAQTRKERDALIAQKQEMQKRGATSPKTDASASNPTK